MRWKMLWALGALLAHDAKGGAPLIPTLRAYVDNGGRKCKAGRDFG